MVATVLYMMALQEMTSCPFRCVDEINQVLERVRGREEGRGLRARGERMIATVLYMMALQEMTSCLFICVNEINQVWEREGGLGLRGWGGQGEGIEE